MLVLLRIVMALGVAASASALGASESDSMSHAVVSDTVTVAGPTPGADPVRAGFEVRFRDVTTPYRVFMLRALPGERVGLEVVAGAGSFDATASAGAIRRLSERHFEWDAPTDPGVYPLTIRSAASPSDSIVLNGIVLVPLDQSRNGAVDGYRVGDYPSKPYRDMPQYLPPPGFIRLTAANAATRVSPHFTLGQFPAKAPKGYPKYLVLHERLLLKLERLLEETRARGVEARTFQVLSGFRSPWYNAGIGRPRYSRHIYGDAADIYVDDDGDGRMDDLNGDGRVDVGDAAVLYNIVQEMDGDPSMQYLLGGLGKYPVTPNHGPFIHVDTRLWRARW